MPSAPFIQMSSTRGVLLADFGSSCLVEMSRLAGHLVVAVVGGGNRGDGLLPTPAAI